jgi:RHS repeat-associated protein
LLPIRRRASQHPRRANRSPRGTRPSCTLTARPCAASQKAATTPLTNHKKNHQPRFIRNQQYSITAVSDGGGSVVERYAYSAYGQVTIADGTGSQISNSAISNRYTYTGREWDEGLSLYHYRARMYDAVGGRFVSRDPIGYPDGANAYASYFCVAFTDPTGESVSVFQQVVKPVKKAGCGFLEVDVMIRISNTQRDSRGSVAYLVQELTYMILKSDCLKTSDDCCETQELTKDTYTIVEVLGRIELKAGSYSPQIKVSPTRGSNAPDGSLKDSWSYDVGAGGNCGSVGSITITSKLHIVSDDLERIWNTADPDKPIESHDPPIKHLPGPATLPPGVPLASSSGSAAVIWDCCDGRTFHFAHGKP